MLAVGAFMIMLVAKPDYFLDSASRGLLLFASSVLPAVFPFFFCSTLLTAVGAASSLSRIGAKPVHAMFNAPPSGAYVLALSLLGGYPVGAATVADLYAKGIVNETDAKRIASFTSTSGPIFVLGTVGSAIFGDPAVGALILAAHYAAAVTTGLVFRGRKKSEVTSPVFLAGCDTDSALSNSISSSTLAMLAVGGYVVVGNMLIDALSLSALAAERGSYVCLKMRLNSRGRQLPLSYVRNLVEDNLPDTVAFVHQRSYVVAFSRLDGLAPEGERRAALERLLAPMTDSIGMRVGISDHLLGLESARTYYLQAGVALELGMALDPKGTVYRFQQYALPELIMNSLGELPVEAYYTPGLRRLLEHDGHSSVSYIDTLERYLSLNMNVSATARELYLHRSTLIERLSRIREDMGQELDDPKTRLRIQLLLEARGLERSLGELGAT